MMSTQRSGGSAPAVTMDVYKEIEHLTMWLKVEVELAKLKSRLAFHQSSFVQRSNVDFAAAAADPADSDSDLDGSALGTSMGHRHGGSLSRTSTGVAAVDDAGAVSAVDSASLQEARRKVQFGRYRLNCDHSEDNKDDAQWI